ncbi:MAG: aminotransferase class V-fold PLP-dependent enzyme [Planctomycetaceae bacterium]|nr:aminotransferase class V-fold PLP-dependent enzyme [Planctomycetaceae bacterium]
MAGPFYLDTARLGLISPGAAAAYRDFVGLAGEEGLSLYAEEFLRYGEVALTADHRHQFPGLKTWPGIAGLRAGLADAVHSPPGLPVLLASRSVALMRLAARLLFRFCRNVLATDFSWPHYAQILAAEAARTGNRVTVVPLRAAVFRDGATAGELAARIADVALREMCDGLFLPAVSHDGVALPAAEMVRTAERVSEVRFVVIDGAQAFCHIPVDLSGGWCDLFLAGCHKWLGAYHPLGLAFCGRNSSADAIRTAALRPHYDGGTDDPLLSLLAAFETGELEGFGETVNTGPLFSCSGALHDLGRRGGAYAIGMSAAANGEHLRDAARDAGWSLECVDWSLRTGIALVRPRSPSSHIGANALRGSLARHGIAASVYDDHTVRLSAQRDRPAAADLDRLTAALRAAG